MAANGFSTLIFTTNGLNLLAKAQSGTQLTFTRIAVGDGILNGQDATTFTALLHQVMSLGIEKDIVSGTQATLTAALSNSSLSTGFYWREIGVFATDPQLGEILYAYANSGDGDIYVPDKNTSTFEAPCNVGVNIGTAASVTIQQSSIVYAKESEVQDIVDGTTTVGKAAQADNATAAAGYTAGGGIDVALSGKAASSHTHTSSAITDFASAVLSGVLTGLSTATNAAIAAADTVLSALGKLQAQITANGSAISTLSGAAVLIKKSCADTEITTTSATSVLTWTPPVMGDFTVKTYIRVTVPTTVAVALTYTDASGAQTVTILPSQSVAVGSHMLPEYFFNALSTGPITLSITAGTANQVYASSEIDGNYIYD